MRKSVKAEEGLTARQTGRADAKAGLSDPAVACGSAVAQRIKGTPGITGLSPPRVHIDGEVWHLDVGSILGPHKKKFLWKNVAYNGGTLLFNEWAIPWEVKGF